MAATTAATTAATSAARRLLDRLQSVGTDRLHFDFRQTGGGGEQCQPGRFGSAPPQHVQQQFLTVERPFQIKQVELQLPVDHPLPPRLEARLSVGTRRFRGGQLLRRGDTQHPLPARFFRRLMVSMSVGRTARATNRFEYGSQLDATRRLNDDGATTGRGRLDVAGESTNFRNGTVPNEKICRHDVGDFPGGMGLIVAISRRRVIHRERSE